MAGAATPAPPATAPRRLLVLRQQPELPRPTRAGHSERLARDCDQEEAVEVHMVVQILVYMEEGHLQQRTLQLPKTEQ